MKIIIKESGKQPYEKEIKNDLTVLQEIVGGYIEVLPITQEILMICNEEGKLEGLPYNFTLGNDYIVGTVFFIGNNEPEFRSLDDAEIKVVMNWFK